MTNAPNGTRTRGPRQQSIPGTEPDHPEVAEAIENWLEACEHAKAAAEKKAEADDRVVVKMLELGVQHYPYTDPESGKRKWRVVDTTPRGKSISARPTPVTDEADEPELSESETPSAAGSSAQAAADRLHAFADSMPGTTVTVSVGGGHSVRLGRSGKRKTNAQADRVEHRKVPRSTAAREIQKRDEHVRAQDAEDAPVDEVAQANAANAGAARKARDWEAEDAEGGGAA